jgi:hypothetical protein
MERWKLYAFGAALFAGLTSVVANPAASACCASHEQGRRREESRVACNSTAAVVGVILNLGVKFSQAALWPGDGAKLDMFVGIPAVAAFIAMQRFKLSHMPTISICAALGLVKHLIF